MTYDKILFVDFDGTITTEETLEGTIKLFTNPEEYQKVYKEFQAGKVTLANVVHYAFSQIPSSQFGKIRDYYASVPIRPGFAACLETAGEKGIPVVIISGGLGPCIEEKLAPYRKQLLDVYALATDCSGPTIALHSDYEEGNEIMSKVRVMERYSYRQALCVGDSFTDVEMAKASSVVFARDRLAAILTKAGLPFHPYETFFDVDKVLKKE